MRAHLNSLRKFIQSDYCAGLVFLATNILPVAKGGKTVPENLRTLCSDCNLGKSDKYDKKGKN